MEQRRHSVVRAPVELQNGEEGGDRMECGVGWRARGRTALKAEHGRSERAPPLAAGERLPRGGRWQGQGGSARARASGRGAG